MSLSFEHSYISEYSSPQVIMCTLSNLVLLFYFFLPSHSVIIKTSCILLYSVLLYFYSTWSLPEATQLKYWAIIFFFVNLLLVFYKLIKKVYKKFKCCNDNNHNKDFYQIYSKLFAPLQVTKNQFRKIIDCKRCVKIIGQGDHYAIEKSSRVDSLGFLVTGRLLVSQNNRPLHIILPYQFIDSPEYFGVSTDEIFQVTITALEECKLLIWHRDKLRLTIMSDEFLHLIFDHIIGRDVVRKLIQVSDTVGSQSQQNYHHHHQHHHMMDHNLQFFNHKKNLFSQDHFEDTKKLISDGSNHCDEDGDGEDDQDKNKGVTNDEDSFIISSQSMSGCSNGSSNKGHSVSKSAWRVICNNSACFGALCYSIMHANGPKQTLIIYHDFSLQKLAMPSCLQIYELSNCYSWVKDINH